MIVHTEFCLSESTLLFTIISNCMGLLHHEARQSSHGISPPRGLALPRDLPSHGISPPLESALPRDKPPTGSVLPQEQQPTHMITFPTREALPWEKPFYMGLTRLLRITVGSTGYSASNNYEHFHCYRENALIESFNMTPHLIRLS